jgi:hypothetical protein
MEYSKKYDDEETKMTRSKEVTPDYNLWYEKDLGVMLLFYLFRQPSWQ